jgi:SAM-dependent methyltransferase
MAPLSHLFGTPAVAPGEPGGVERAAQTVGSPEVVWHDLECGGYREDLPLWRKLAAAAGGPVLEIGAGTGRVTLDLAARGVEMIALDSDARLLAALAGRADGRPVETVVADARDFSLGRLVPLVLVPMQGLQLMGGRQGRAAFLRRARDHLEPGGLLAAAVADAIDCFDAEHTLPPRPDVCEIGGARYASQLVAVTHQDGQAAIHRRREIVGPAADRHSESFVLPLDRVSADEVASEAAALGLLPQPHLFIPETEEFLGSTVVALRAP